MKSFETTQFEEIKSALSKYGFVVVRNILTPEQCSKTIDEFFFDLNRRAEYTQKEIISPDDPKTWETCNFPTKSKFLVETPAFTPNAFKNRCNTLIYDIYCHLFQRKDLWCNIDNWGLFRGTKDLLFKDGDKEVIMDRPDWRHNLKLHWDYNPWTLQKWMDKGDPELYQGLVALSDCPCEVGGFMAVPGSHIFFCLLGLKKDHVLVMTIIQ